jgi:uncharacterized protein (TIGR02145 family)
MYGVVSLCIQKPFEGVDWGFLSDHGLCNHILVSFTFVKIYFMRHVTSIMSMFLIVGGVFCQSPWLLPYQAVARSSNGQPWVNATLSARFTLREGSVSGENVWQELQTVMTNAQGLFSVQLGSVNPLNGVNWSGGDKFMQVELNEGNGFVDIGTQQMLSAPYALHTEGIDYTVSATGDTLFIGSGEYVIVPGISAANASGGGSNGGDGGGGSAGNTSGTTAHTCGANHVVNANLTYNSVIDQEGNIYKTIVIGTREWMAENLNTSIYRNGDPIVTDLNATQWSGTNLGAWAYYNGDTSRECPYGKLYNFYACTDSRQLCPTGWHVPTDAEWSALINIYDPGAQGGINWSNSAGGPLKATGTSQAGTGYWNAPNTGATNASGFSALPGGFVTALGASNNAITQGYYWTSTQVNDSTGYGRSLYSDPGAIIQTANFNKRSGMSVRCVKD